MGRTGTMTVLFTDIVGSTELLDSLGERGWDDVRKTHFDVLRGALAEHEGVEVKNLGDGIMAVFRSAIGAVDCSISMQMHSLFVTVQGTPVGLRIGISTGEATEDQGDWFGTPVVEAARLCGLAGTNETWVNALVPVLAGSQTKGRFVSLGPQQLKGFDQPIDVFRIEPVEASLGTMYAQPDLHDGIGERLVAALDWWERLPSLQRVRAAMIAELAPRADDVICDIGCGAGTELVRLAQMVGKGGQAIGVDPSRPMLDEARRRAEHEGVDVQLVARDGRDTGLPAESCDAVRIERVIQHVGDVQAFLAEARRITRPGGRIVIADSDWGSLMIHPGNPDLIHRIKAGIEHGPMAEPWAGRSLHGAMLDARLEDVTSRMFPLDTGIGVPQAVGPMFAHLVRARLATQAEVDEQIAITDAALRDGWGVFALTMFVASGRVPE